MSTEGFGEVISILSNSLSGVGTLVSKGVMWCGRKMIESYEACAKSFQSEYVSVPISSAKSEERQHIMVCIIEQLSDSSATSSTSNTDEELAQIFNKALANLNLADQSKRTKEEHEYNHAQRLLRMEISKCQGFVPTEDIIRAKQALDGSLETIQTAYRELQQAWLESLEDTDDTQLLRTLQIRQTKDTVTQIQQELATMRKLLQQNDEVINAKYEPKLNGIEKVLQLAEQRIGPDVSINDPQKALEDAQQARKELQTLKQSVAHTLAEEWDKRSQKLAEAKGRLKALETMVQDAIKENVVTLGDGNTFLQESIRPCQKELEETEAQPENEKVAALLAEIEQVAQQTFRMIGEGQQYIVAEQISSTLNELGFTANPASSAAPVIEKVGASVRVFGMQDEKITIFYIDRDGGVSYDFSGYKGSECTITANKVFAALREKGLIIVDEKGAQKISQYPLSTLTAELLRDDEFAPQFDENKLQTKIHDHILHVLQDKMGFTQIIQNTSGGSIVIDAFHGHVGYHVILSSEGKATVKKHSDDDLQDTEDELMLALSLPLISLSPDLPEPSTSPQEVLPEVAESKRTQTDEESDQMNTQEGRILGENTN